MTLNVEFAKRHWPVLTGAAVGLLLLYYVLKHGAGSGGSASSVDVSGGAALASGASLGAAQVNAQVEMAQLQSAVASHQTDAQLEASLTNTAAQLSATQQQTGAAEAVALGGQETALEIQRVQSSEHVTEAQIVGQTWEDLGTLAANTKAAQLALTGKQVGELMKHNVDTWGKSLTALAPIIAVESGQPSAVAPLAQASAVQASQPSTLQTITSGLTSGIGSLFSGLFG